MKTAETTEDTDPQIHADLKAAENEFIGIKEYNSAIEIAEKIDKEAAETKSKLGEYLRQLRQKSGSRKIAKTARCSRQACKQERKQGKPKQN